MRRRYRCVHRPDGFASEYRYNRHKRTCKGLHDYIPHCVTLRCFAKSDIQPLLNDGAKKSDVAASIFQSVVNQTISGLACGKPIRGHVAFLGGPLHYLSELRKRFIETLQLDDEHIVFPPDANLFVAMGASLAENREELSVDKLRDDLKALANVEVQR